MALLLASKDSAMVMKGFGLKNLVVLASYTFTCVWLLLLVSFPAYVLYTSLFSCFLLENLTVSHSSSSTATLIVEGMLVFGS